MDTERNAASLAELLLYAQPARVAAAQHGEINERIPARLRTPVLRHRPEYFPGSGWKRVVPAREHESARRRFESLGLPPAR